MFSFLMSRKVNFFRRYLTHLFVFDSTLNKTPERERFRDCEKNVGVVVSNRISWYLSQISNFIILFFSLGVSTLPLHFFARRRCHEKKLKTFKFLNTNTQQNRDIKISNVFVWTSLCCARRDPMKKWSVRGPRKIHIFFVKSPTDI